MSIFLDFPPEPPSILGSWYDGIFKQENSEHLSNVQNLFKEKLGFDNDRIFQQMWNQALNVHRIDWNPAKPLTQELFDKIEKALRETLVYDGPGLDHEGDGANPEIHEIFQYLLGRGVPNRSWLNRKNLSALMLEKDLILLQAIRQEIRATLASCAAIADKVSPQEELVLEAFVGNLISLIPYSYPEVGEEFIIPQKVGNEWRALQYRIDEKIELTPEWFSSPITACGLSCEEGPALLTFIGTTFPAGDGYVATVLADFTPGCSVGEFPYWLGKEKIASWLDRHGSARLYGASLGGAMTFQTLRDQKDKIEAVYAYNPPGLYPWNWKETYDETGPKVHIYCQENDIIATMGVYPQGRNVSVYHVFAEGFQQMPKAHARAFTGSDHPVILKGDANFENQRFYRKALTAIHMLFGGTLIFAPVLLSYLLCRALGQTAKAIQHVASRVLKYNSFSC